jgi:parallel beta helix pectate lyase-like protein
MGTTTGTRMTDLRGVGWGEMGFFCNGGEVIKSCHLVQTDPSLSGNQSSHGVYIHSGAKDVLIEDCHFENARKFGAQIWGQQPGTTCERVTFRRTTFKACRSGVAIQQGELTANRAKQIRFENCLILGTYEGIALHLAQGDGITVTGCTLDGGRDGLALGVWSPAQAGFSLTGVRASGNIIRNMGEFGIYALASNGGRFVDCIVGPNTLSLNRQDYERSNAPGISWL